MTTSISLRIKLSLNFARLLQGRLENAFIQNSRKMKHLRDIARKRELSKVAEWSARLPFESGPLCPVAVSEIFLLAVRFSKFRPLPLLFAPFIRHRRRSQTSPLRYLSVFDCVWILHGFCKADVKMLSSKIQEKWMHLCAKCKHLRRDNQRKRELSQCSKQWTRHL